MAGRRHLLLAATYYHLPRAGLNELGGGAAMKCIEREVFVSEFVALALPHPREGY